MRSVQNVRPFQFRFSTDGLQGAILEIAAEIAGRCLSFPQLNDIYARACRDTDRTSFPERALAAMDVTYAIRESDFSRIPATGPLVVVANHPFGGVEGLVLAAMLLRVRRDVRLLGNLLLGCMPEMREISIFVNPFGGARATAQNLGAMRTAIRWVREGSVLGVFPSGEVSHLTWRNRSVTDPPWSDTIARIVQRAGAAVLPVFFEGRNSRLFQLAGLLHPRLRTALLPRELINKQHTSIVPRIGAVISPSRLARIDDPGELIEYVRARTYLLSGRTGSNRGVATRSTRDEVDAIPLHMAASRMSMPRARSSVAPIVSAVDPAKTSHEINALPIDRTLLAYREFRVICTRAGEIPLAMREIGRLRETTFRAAGEGTGKEIDLDRFDEHYHHLFIWNAEQSRIIGAYRLGATDELVPQLGLAGLYTNSLFSFKSSLLKQIDPALELGRSFVVEDHQRSYSALLLLWRGIGRFVCLNPRYRMLFGTVSISDDYQSMTKQLLMVFLNQNQYRSKLASFVRAKNPPRLGRMRRDEERRVTSVVHNLDEVDELVADIESNRRGMPVLLRQYLRLNAKILGFNIDPDFGDVLDGLVLIDLTQIERAMLYKYLGKSEAETILAVHTPNAATLHP